MEFVVALKDFGGKIFNQLSDLVRESIVKVKAHLTDFFTSVVLLFELLNKVNFEEANYYLICWLFTKILLVIVLRN